MFYFFGRILAKALFDKIPLNLCMNRGLFNGILGKINEYDYRELNEFKTVDYNVTTLVIIFRCIIV